MQYYRNNWDPTAYWVCTVQNQPAAAFRCPTSFGFLESAGTCVPFDTWEWTPPCVPPSQP